MITQLTRHRAQLAHDAYDLLRQPYWPTGDAALPRCFLDKDPDGMPVITCEGSRPIFKHPVDWKTNFDQLNTTIDLTCEPVPHGWGHAMLGVIFRVFAKFDDPTLAVGWNGHSMGGSDALIGAWLWKLAGRPLGYVTAFEPGPVGPLSNMLKEENVLITRVGPDVVPIATERGHPAPVFELPADPAWNVFDCHEMLNVIAAIDTLLHKTVDHP